MTVETFLANFGHLANAPNGVRKLRELILQLAVQGKLVPQDPKDESAAKLLERIRKEKGAKGSRRGRACPAQGAASSAPTPDEMPYELPSRWLWVRLNDIGMVSPSNDIVDDLDASFVPMALISEKYGEPIKSDIKKWSEIKKGFTHFAEGDVVLAKITPCFQNGKSAVMRGLKNGVGAGTTELHVFRSWGDTMCPEYVLAYLKSPAFIDEGIPKMTGSAGQKRVPREYFSQSPFPLPPLAEQYRIVTKVDQLMALCNELEARQRKQQNGRVRLNNAVLDALLNAGDPADFATHWQRICANFDLLYDHPDTIAKLRAAILQLAVQGKLVPQDPKDEPARMLLEKVRKEKSKQGAGRRSTRTAPTELVSSDEIPFELPVGWQAERFGNLTNVVGGVTLGRKLAANRTATYPYLRVANVQRWTLDLSVVKEVEILADELEKYRLQHGDLLITEGGDWDKVGRTAIWEDQIENCLHQNHVFRARLISEQISHQWLVLAINSPVGREYFASSSKQTTNLASINMTQLKYFPMPVPPASEQRRIVAKVDQLMALCDALEAKLNQARQKREQLMETSVRQLLVA